jgi:hypothetical protein
MQRKCEDKNQAVTNRHHARMNEIVSEDDDEIETEYFMFKNTGVRLMVEDPYGIQGHGRPFKGDGLPNIIGKTYSNFSMVCFFVYLYSSFLTILKNWKSNQKVSRVSLKR